jgi:hypothetical protein
LRAVARLFASGGNGAICYALALLTNVKLAEEPRLRIPNMFDAAIEGTFLGLYVRGRSPIPIPSTSLQGDDAAQRIGRLGK